jgi:hypothetical protein
MEVVVDYEQAVQVGQRGAHPSEWGKPPSNGESDFIEYTQQIPYRGDTTDRPPREEPVRKPGYS